MIYIYIIIQLAIHTTYIPGRYIANGVIIYVYITYHLLQEPGNSIDNIWWLSNITGTPEDHLVNPCILIWAHSTHGTTRPSTYFWEKKLDEFVGRDYLPYTLENQLSDRQFIPFFTEFWKYIQPVVSFFDFWKKTQQYQRWKIRFISIWGNKKKCPFLAGKTRCWFCGRCPHRLTCPPEPPQTSCLPLHPPWRGLGREPARFMPIETQNITA